MPHYRVSKYLSSLSESVKILENKYGLDFKSEQLNSREIDLLREHFQEIFHLFISHGWNRIIVTDMRLALENYCKPEIRSSVIDAFLKSAEFLSATNKTGNNHEPIRAFLTRIESGLSQMFVNARVNETRSRSANTTLELTIHKHRNRSDAEHPSYIRPSLLSQSRPGILPCQSEASGGDVGCNARLFD